MVTPLVKHKIIKKRTLRFRRYQSDRKVTVKVSDGRIVNTKHRDARGGKTRGFAKKRREKRQGEAGLLNGGRGFFPGRSPLRPHAARVHCGAENWPMHLSVYTFNAAVAARQGLCVGVVSAWHVRCKGVGCRV
jgi:hypothetical protein